VTMRKQPPGALEGSCDHPASPGGCFLIVTARKPGLIGAHQSADAF
jgi:hypothetical protein